MSSFGRGIFKGMAVTLKNFALSYVDGNRKERLPTVQYPEEGDTVMEFSRNLPFLVYDGENEIEGMRCVACQICERECPPACIYIVKEKDENGKFVKRPKVFDLDASVCMGCQICVEACPFDAIVMDSEFELSSEDRFDGLLYHRDQLLKSNDYYHEIHPDEARERDDRLAAKKAEDEAKKKAREEKAKQAAAKAAAEKENSEGEESSPPPESKPQPKAEVDKPESKPTPESESESKSESETQPAVAPKEELETDDALADKEPEESAKTDAASKEVDVKASVEEPLSSSGDAESNESKAEEKPSDDGEGEEVAGEAKTGEDSGSDEENKGETGEGAS